MKTQLTLKVSALAIGLLGATTVEAAILNVCQSGCSYSLPSQAYGAAAAGDTIQIQPGTYTDCIYIQKNNLTITGVNGMPKMQSRVCGGKGILVTAAQNLTIRNLELSGATNNDNVAGVRHDAAGFNLTLDNVYIHDNDNGILGSSSGDTITITNSRFENNGMNSGSGYAHNLYIGNAARVTFTNSRSTNTKLKAHEFKSRAASTEIYNSTIATLGGADSRLLDISNGGTLIVRDSVLQKSPSSDNNEMIAWGPEGISGGRTNSVTITGNKVIGDRVPTDLIYFFNQTPPMNISGNVLVAIRTITNAGSAGSNTIYASRSAAGYAAYPYLPSPGGATAPPPTTTTTTTTTVPPNSTGWTFCANENGTCSFSGTRTVRYGAGSSYATRTATGSIACNNNTFGDPAPGVLKHCDYSNTSTTTTPPTTTTTQAPSSSWTFCANENGTCSFSGTRTVRYGAGSSYTTRTATGSIACNNSTFGDPAPGVLKHCDYSNTSTTTTLPPTTTTTQAPSSGWTFCANEGGTCSFTGTRTVRYGAGSSYATKTVTGSIACTNENFGDPIYGVAKHCDFSSSTTSTPTSANYKLQTRINAGFCLDSAGSGNATQSHLWQCLSGVSNQLMTFTSAGEIRVNGKCLDGYTGRAGDPLVIQDCHGGSNQKWNFNSSTGEITGVNGLCIDVFSGTSAYNGAKIGIWNCHGGTNQKWNRVNP